MLTTGDAAPLDATVWRVTGERTTLGAVLAGRGHVLVCFYPFDWSPG